MTIPLRDSGTNPPKEKIFISSDRDWTYAEIQSVIEKVAAWRLSTGLHPGDRVVVALADAALAAMTALALMRNGLTAVMIDADSTATEAAAMIAQATPTAAIASPGLIAAWGLEPGVTLTHLIGLGSSEEKPAGLAARLLGALRPAADPFAVFGDVRSPPPDDIADESAAYVIFTSGTTLRAKGVVITHRALRAHLTLLQRQYGHDHRSRLLNALPVSHGDGLVQGPLLAYFCGATLVRPPAFAPANIDALLASVYARRITHLIATPTMLSMILRLAPNSLDDVFKGGDFRCVISAAAHLGHDLWQRFEARYGVVVANLYGLTETVTGGIFNGPDAETRRVGFLGKPVGCDIRIVDADGHDVNDGETGEILIAAPFVMAGYVNDPDMTAQVLRDGWLHTGDLARRGEDGFLTYIGRRKNMIISGGLNIQPEEVAETIKRHPGVIDAVVVGEPHPDMGETSVAVVVAQAGTGVDAIIAHCRQSLSEYKVPRRVVLADCLPTGRSGKIIPGQALALVADLKPPPGMEDHAARVIAVAATVFRVPATALSLDSRPEDTPGWDSLGHLLLAGSLEKEFAIVLTPEDIVGITCLGDACRIATAKQAA